MAMPTQIMDVEAVGSISQYNNCLYVLLGKDLAKTLGVKRRTPYVARCDEASITYTFNPLQKPDGKVIQKKQTLYLCVKKPFQKELSIEVRKGTRFKLTVDAGDVTYHFSTRTL